MNETTVSLVNRLTTFARVRLYLVSMVLIAGNLLLPYLAHQFGISGQVFLPIYFFSLLGGLVYGWKVGVLTGFLSPLVSYYLSAMPLMTILPMVLLKSIVLGGVSGILTVKRTSRTIFPAALAAVGAAQLVGLVIGQADFEVGYLGLIIQITLVPVLAGILVGNEDEKVNSHNQSD